MIIIGGFTVFIIDLFAKQNTNINIWIASIIGVIAVYYIIKCIILIKKEKKNN